MTMGGPLTNSAAYRVPTPKGPPVIFLLAFIIGSIPARGRGTAVVEHLLGRPVDAHLCLDYDWAHRCYAFRFV